MALFRCYHDQLDKGNLALCALHTQKRSMRTKKKIPTSKSESTAAAFVDKADLAHYELPGAQLARFEEAKRQINQPASPANFMTLSANAPTVRDCLINGSSV